MSTKRRLLVAFFLLLFVYSIFMMGFNLLDDCTTIVQQKNLINSIKKVDSPPVNEQDSLILPEYQQLYKRNPDMVGWLKIEGTPIDYPVMQHSQDPDFYLNHDFDGKENRNGLPFLDARCDIQGSNALLIHGHNMKNGLMFNSLMQYKKEEFFQEHSRIRFDTLYEQSNYDVLAVILSEVFPQSEKTFKYYQLDIKTTESFDSYIKHIKELSLYDTGLSAQYGDQLIILSTCEYSRENGRLAVIARKSASRAQELSSKQYGLVINEW